MALMTTFPDKDLDLEIYSANVRYENGKAYINWYDPEYTAPVINGYTISALKRWAGTKVVRYSSVPLRSSRGTLIVDNTTHNAYSETTLVDEPDAGANYYRLFPYDTNGVETAGPVLYVYKKPEVMTVEIDLTDSNPATCCSLADDAVGKTWQELREWMGYHPVLIGDTMDDITDLDPDDYTKTKAGATADTANKNTFVAFPRKDVKISKENNKLTISFTNQKGASGFDALAFIDATDTAFADTFYVGAYLSYQQDSSNLPMTRPNKDISGTLNMSLSNRLEQSKNLLSGHTFVMGYYQWIYIQAAYILIHQNLNCQSKVGKGYVASSNTGNINTGGSEQYGMDMELAPSTYKTDGKHHVKCLGIEDLWGNVTRTWMAGVCVKTVNSIHMICTTQYPSTFNTTGSGHLVRGDLASSDQNGYISSVMGNIITGFAPVEYTGSNSTYFSDKALVQNYSGYCIDNGGYNNGDRGGIFGVIVDQNNDGNVSETATRLMLV